MFGAHPHRVSSRKRPLAARRDANFLAPAPGEAHLGLAASIERKFEGRFAVFWPSALSSGATFAAGQSPSP